MLSVIVIAKNEEKMIAPCLESIKQLADEIIVVDNGSSDKTIEIAKRYTDKIMSFEGQDFAALRNKAAEKVVGDWILYVDADERVLSSLKEEILELVQNGDKSAYAISRRNIIFGKEVSYGSYKHDWVIRLLRKKDFDGWVGRVHEYPKFKGTLGFTKNSLLHLTHRGVDQMILKNLEWSNIDANLRLEAGHPKMEGWRFLRIFITELFYQGIIRKGFFNGTVGVMDSMIQVFSLFTTYVRLWEIQQPKSMEQIYKEIDEKLIKNDFKL